MGSGKKVIVSYWYKLIAHFGFAKGPVDAMLAWKGGDRVIWTGEQTTSGIISVNKPDLYGGESSEGGVVGDFELRMGEHNQTISDYLTDIFGAFGQSGHRGKLTGILRGAKIGAGNPYPKAMTFKFRRILKGWTDDVCWYAAKAPILLSGTEGEPEVLLGVGGFGTGGAEAFVVFEPTHTYTPADDDWPARITFRMREIDPASAMHPRRVIFTNVDTGKVVWDSGWCGDATDQVKLEEMAVAAGRPELRGPIGPPYPEATVTFEDSLVPEAMRCDAYTCLINDGRVMTTESTTDIFEPEIENTQAFGMNPAHILYDSITSRKEEGGMGELTARIDTTSFTAAADQAFDEGFGLCTALMGGESALQFQQRICNVVGWCMSQDLLDGQYYIDRLRDDYVLDDLPILHDNDILTFECKQNSLTEAVNHVSVKWWDQRLDQERITTPLQSLGAIESAGGVIPEVREYYELPLESLALRVADRDLRTLASPLWRFTVTANQRALLLRRPGRYFRLQAPLRGFPDMVCVVGKIDVGSSKSGEITLEFMQDVFALADTVYVDPQDSLDPDDTAAEVGPAAFTRAIETPYVELASTLSLTELANLEDDSGFIQVGAGKAAAGNDYTLATAVSGEEFETYEVAAWTPHALMPVTSSKTEEDFTFTAGSLLSSVVLGTWALWGDEMVRVDALDIGAGTISLGRGCGDTVPSEHLTAERIVFIGDWASTDQREYVDGELVYAKALTRTGSDQLAVALAPAAMVEFNSRHARPYPPGKLRFTDDLNTNAAYPTVCGGELTLTWAHRDRVLQADQLVDQSMDSVGPESGVTVTVRYYLDDVLEATQTGILLDTTTYEPSASGVVRVEVESVRVSDGGASDIDGGYEAGGSRWVQNPAVVGGGTFTALDDDPLLAETGDWRLRYDGVPGAPGVWTTDEILFDGFVLPPVFPGPAVTQALSLKSVDLTPTTQLLVAVRGFLDTYSADGVDFIGRAYNDSVLRGWGQYPLPGWQRKETRSSYVPWSGANPKFKPGIEVSSYPQGGSPPAGYTVDLDNFAVTFEGYAGTSSTLVSWQKHVHEFDYIHADDAFLESEGGDMLITEDGDVILSEG